MKLALLQYDNLQIKMLIANKEDKFGGFSLWLSK